MTDASPRPGRRAVIMTAAGLAVAPAVLGAGTPARAQAPVSARPGEFDFLSGEWRIRHRRLKGPGDWDEFEGEATCWSILGGVASVEELRIPARDFSGMGLRTLDAANGVWLDFWMNAKTGVPGSAGTPGRFVDGVGNFDADETADGAPVKYRGAWDEIAPTSCRWRQGASRDGGQTWDWNWIMQWTRVG
jgi:hypothetical protein